MPTLQAVVSGQKATPAKARLTCGRIVIDLPYWPDSWQLSGMSGVWEEQVRPGRKPILVRKSLALPQIVVEFEVGKGIDNSCRKTLSDLRSMAVSTTPTTVTAGAFQRGRYRITDLSWEETDHAISGEPSKADVTLTLKEASDLVVPIGPAR